MLEITKKVLITYKQKLMKHHIK